MSDKNTGGPAFPVPHHLNHGGMSLRDYFAVKAMQAILSSTKTDDSVIIAFDAYKMADSMLKAREA